MGCGAPRFLISGGLGSGDSDFIAQGLGFRVRGLRGGFTEVRALV